MIIWLILICGILALLYLYLQRKINYWNSRGIPGTNTFYDAVKKIYDIFKKPLFLIQFENYKRYGRIYGTFEGLKPILVIADPNLVKTVLVKDFNVFHNRIRLNIGEPIFEQMLQFARGSRWKRIRCVMSPTFTSGKMKKMSSLVKECSDNFIKHCKLLTDRNEALDCKKYFQAYALDVVASTAFGTKLDSMLDKNNEFVKKANILTSREQPTTFLIIVLFPFLFRLTGSFFRGVMDFFRGIALRIIEDRKKQNVKGCDFLQLMLDSQEGTLEVTTEDMAEINEQKEILPKQKTLTTDEILSQCVLFLLVGNETTSTTMSFITYYLATNPSCQDKLIQEIDEAWKKHEKINFDVVNKLPYLNAVISETLRLHPVLFWLVRECSRDYTFEGTGITIKKGSAVHIPVYSMHHDSEFFPDPEKFNPNRFLPENKHLVPQYAYLPFGEGPRNCIGMRFALMVIKLAMAHLLRELKIIATDETKKPLKYYRGQQFILPKALEVKMESRTN